MSKWMTMGWWRYLLGARDDHRVARRTVVWCRIKGHPDGPIYFNPGGLEPDPRCSNCLEVIA